MAKLISTFRLDKDTLDFLNFIKDKLGARNLTEALTIIISTFKDNDKNKQTILNEKDFYVKYKLANNEGKNEIRIKLSDDEIEVLKNLAKFHGYTTNNKIVKFIVLDKIYSQQILTKIDLINLNKLSKDIKKAGINLNQIVKHINAFNGNDILFLKEKIINSISEVENQVKNVSNFITNQANFLRNKDLL